MRRVVGFIVVGALLSGCATTPQRAVGKLDQADQKYHTEDCIQARGEAMQFDNKVFTRIGTGMMLGLLGPFGLPLAISADAYQNDQRKQMNAELVRQCHSAPGEVIPAAVARQQPVPVAAKPREPAPAVERGKACGGAIRVLTNPDALSCD